MNRGSGNDRVDTYPTEANGVLTADALRRACSHVWRDSNSTTMLGADILSSEPVSCDDSSALSALKRHISAAGPSSFVHDVLPKLGFGAEPAAVPETLRCPRCGGKSEPLHLGCTLCEECCDCRPTGT